MSWLLGLVGVALDALRLWLGLKKKDAAQQVAETDHAMLQAAVDRTDPRAVADDMRRGDF